MADDARLYYILEAARGEEHFALDNETGTAELQKVLCEPQVDNLFSLAALYYLQSVNDDTFSALELGFVVSVIDKNLSLKDQYMTTVINRLKYLNKEKYHELEKKLVEKECYRISLPYIDSSKEFNNKLHHKKNNEFVAKLQGLRQHVNVEFQMLPTLKVFQFTENKFSPISSGGVTLYSASQTNTVIEVDVAADIDVDVAAEFKAKTKICWGPQVLECYKRADSRARDEQSALNTRAAEALTTVYNYTRFVPQRLSLEQLWLIVKVVSDEDAFAKDTLALLKKDNFSEALLYQCASKALMSQRLDSEPGYYLLTDIHRLRSIIEKKIHKTNSSHSTPSYWDQLKIKVKNEEILELKEAKFILEHIDFLSNPSSYKELVDEAIKAMELALSKQCSIYPPLLSYVWQSSADEVKLAYPSGFKTFEKCVMPKQGGKPYAFAFYCLHILQKKTIHAYEIDFIIRHFKCLQNLMLQVGANDINLLPSSTMTEVSNSIMHVIGDELKKRLKRLKTIEQLQQFKALFPPRGFICWDDNKNLQDSIQRRIAELQTSARATK